MVSSTFVYYLLLTNHHLLLRLLNYLTTSGWCEILSHLLPTNYVEQGLLLCEVVVKAMLLLEDCDYATSVELLERMKKQFSHLIIDNDTYTEAYNNVVTLLHRITKN